MSPHDEDVLDWVRRHVEWFHDGVPIIEVCGCAAVELERPIPIGDFMQAYRTVCEEGSWIL